jgi:hypothetical protein
MGKYRGKSVNSSHKPRFYQEGVDVNFLKRSMLAVAAIGAAGVLVAGGAVPALAATSSGVRYQNLAGTGIGGSGNTSCELTLLSAAASTGKPAYISIAVESDLPGSCTAWVQRSVNGGAWKNVSAKTTLPGRTEDWFKSANYYAGPGNQVRGCVQVGKEVLCTVGVALAKSAAKPASDAIGRGYIKKTQVVGSGSSVCGTILSGSTASKVSASRASLITVDLGRSCTTWLEGSTNKGKTWTQVSPTYSVLSTGQFAFSGTVADGASHLVRACVKNGTSAKKCTSAW